MAGKMDMTTQQIRACLLQLLQSNGPVTLTPEQRYSIKSSVETMGFLERLSPGLKKAMDEIRHKHA
jgi:hypothetical protein